MDIADSRQKLTLLFLGGAKRVSMARMFMDAAAARACSCRIISYEMDRHVPLACLADIVIGKRWNDPAVFDDLHDIVESEAVDIIVPFVDGAVAVACEYVRRYPGSVFVPAADAATADEMFDKVRAAALFERLGLPVPKTYIPGEPCLRLIAKPRRGSASKGIVHISSVEALDDILPRADEYLIQERIDRREEYSVDCYVSVRSGEVLALSDALTRRVLASTGLRGAVTVQFMRDLDDGGRLLLMEINPRLGGGCVCSVHAGADIPSLIIGEALGEKLSSLSALAGVEISRYPAETVFYPDNRIL